MYLVQLLITQLLCSIFRYSVVIQISSNRLVFEDTLIEDLHHSSRVICSGHTQYSLVNKKELPSDYEEEDDLESSLKSASYLSSASSVTGKANITRKILLKQFYVLVF